MTAATAGRGDAGTADGVAAVIALLLGAGAFQVLAATALSVSRAELLLPVFTAAWLALYAWAAIRLTAGFGHGWLSWLAVNRPLLLVVLATALVSTAWSINPALTAQRTLHLIGTTLVGIYIGLSLPAGRLLTLTTALFAVLVAGGAALALLAPEHGRQVYDGARVWSGLQGDKNNFGLSAALAALLFATRPFFRGARSHLAYAPLIGLALLDLVMSNSATALGALFAGAGLVAVFLVPVLVRAPQVAGVLAAAAAVFLAVAAIAGLGFGEAFGLFGRSADLTGRSEIWRSVVALIGRHPLSGVGYGALWFPRAGDETAQMATLETYWTAFHAHNGLLQIASELGIPVTLAAMALFVQVLIEPIRLFWRTFSPFALYMIGFQAALIMNNVFEARWFVDRSFAWLLFIALSTALRVSQQACEALAAEAPADDARPAHATAGRGPS